MRIAPLMLLLSLPLTGCRIVEDDPVLSLGNLRMSGYRVGAGSSTLVPDGDLGYAVTANGQGGFRVVWIDTLGTPAGFAGTISNDAGFEPNSTVKFSGTEDVVFTASNRIDFSGRPGASLQGVDFVALADPIYLDLAVDGSRANFGIFFTGAVSGSVRESSFNPVAFTSP